MGRQADPMMLPTSGPPEGYDSGGMPGTELPYSNTLTVHYKVPSAVRWRFVWRNTGGPLIAITASGTPAIRQWATRQNHLSFHRRPTSWCIWQ